MTDLEHIEQYAYEAWDAAEHAHRLVECARADLRRADLREAASSLRIALRSAERTESRARRALELIESALSETP